MWYVAKTSIAEYVIWIASLLSYSSWIILLKKSQRFEAIFAKLIITYTLIGHKCTYLINNYYRLFYADGDYYFILSFSHFEVKYKCS